MDTIETAGKDTDDRFLVNPYDDWAKAQNIPIFEDFGVDMLPCAPVPTKSRNRLREMLTSM